MDVILDGERRALDTSDCANLAELIAMAERSSTEDEDRVVVSIEIDGQALPPDDLGALEGRGLDGIGRVAIERRPTRAVACSVLRQGADYSRQIVLAIDQTVAQFRGGRADRANALLADVTDSLTVLTGITGSVAVALPQAAASLAELQHALFPWLEALVEAQTAEDPLGIADLLEYEIRDRIASWGDVMCAQADLAEAAPSTPGGPVVSN